MPGGDASSQRRKLMAELRRARSGAGLTQRIAAERLSWSQSKLIRIENGAVGISVTDLRAMLQLYGVTDQQSIDDLSDAALHSRGLSWWSRFRDVVSPQFATYLGQEASASSIGVFHPFLIPGLLHTREYATALLEPHTSGQHAQRIVQMRLQRQERLLGHEDSPEAVFVFGEEALYRWIGSPAVMERQLQHVLDVSEQPGITVEVIPFTAGAHAGLLGPFILLGFDDPSESLLFIEGISGDLVSRGDEGKVTELSRHFTAMREQALSASRARALIGQLIGRFGEAAKDGTDEAVQPDSGRLSAADDTSSWSADAREDRWGSLGDGTGDETPRPPQARIRSSPSSPGFSRTPTAPSAAPSSSAVSCSVLSPGSRRGSALW